MAVIFKSDIQSVRGFRVAGIHAGLKTDSRLDLALIVADRPCAAAGIFTTNLVKAAPVFVTQDHIAHSADAIRALLINTTCANAATGAQGLANARRMCAAVAEQIACEPGQVMVMSTGVIGTQLPMPPIEAGIIQAAQSLGQTWSDTASAIMTTDTRPKFCSVQVLTADGNYTIAGIAKGSGMIAPNMATMLSGLFTDAGLSPQQAQAALKFAADRSFNRIVVDGDTSTNDTVTLMASGASGVRVRTETDMMQFLDALTQVCQALAEAIVRDGEGATKFIELHVTGAAEAEWALKIGRTVATSALVKTAFYGNDANWGRIIAAAGRAGVPFDPDRARLWLGSLTQPDEALLLFEAGATTEYSEEDAFAIIRHEDLYLRLDCGAGNITEVIWTCDLSHDYVSINGSYRS